MWAIQDNRPDILHIPARDGFLFTMVLFEDANNEPVIVNMPKRASLPARLKPVSGLLWFIGLYGPGKLVLSK